MKKILMILMLALFCIPWAANAQQSLPYSYGFENNNLATDGWTSSGSNGVISTDAAKTGTYGFRFEYSTSDVYLMSPILSGGTYGVNVSFYYKAYSSSYLDHFNVGYTTDENVTDPSRFTYGSLVTSSTSWQEYTASLPAGTVRVAIKYDSDNYSDGWYLYLDDFTFTAASSCAAPTDLAITYREGDTEATVTWNGEARSYNIDVNGTIEAVTGTSYTISNLTPATTYAVKVQADCGDEQSGWVNAGSFTTPCPETFAIPYAYGFEDASGINCWTLSPADNMAVDNQDPDFVHSGNAFLMLNYTETPPQYVISPELSGIERGLHVEFWYSQYTNGVETFHVGYSTTDNNPDSFTWGDEITASTTYQRFSANYPAETKYVAVKHTANDQYYLFLDDFLFEESANCLEPSSVQVANVTTTGATISWNAGGEETAWDIFVTDDATIMPDETTTPTVANVAENPYTLTSLTPATVYYVYVRALCGDDEASAWSSPAIFNTECVAMELPYSYGFEDATLPVCWNTIVENTSYTGINLMAPSSSSTNQVLAFYMGTYQNPALVAVLPEVDAAYPLNRYQITFDACYANASGGSMTAGKLGIGIMTDPTDVSTFVLVEEVNITDGFSTFGSHTVMLNSYTGNGQYIAIKDIYTQSGYVLVDNIEVTELPSCIVPTNLTVEGGVNAVVAWEGNAESFDIAYSDDNTVDPADNILDNTTENTFNLGEAVNLTEGDYYVWVRANCGTDGYSEWTAPVSFHVGYCTPNPTSHDGKGITGVSFGMGNYVVTNGDGSASLPASAPYYGDYTSMIGAVQAGVESTIAITTGTNSYPYTFVIWVDLDNSMSFEDSDIVYIGKASSGNGTLNATITIPATQTLGDYRMRIYGADSYFTSFYGNGTTNWDAAHDPCAAGTYRHAHDYTLRVLEAPSCLAAGDVTVAPESITSTSAVITWTNNNGEEATYTVMQGETVLTTTAVDSYQLTGLTAATSYPAGTYTIISNCDENAIANVPAFSTLCDDITALPWSEDFEGFDANTVPMCWDNSASTSYISATSSSPNCIWGVVTVNDNKMIKMENYWAQSGTALINTPTIVLPAEGDYQLTFDYAHNADCGAFAVKVSTDNAATFTELASYTKGSGSSHTEPGDFTPATISLADYAGESIILQFFANATYGNGAIFVDNVAVEEIPGCYKILVDEANPEWNETFEGYDVTTTLPERWTGVTPDCWTVPVQYTGTIDTLPQVYQGFNTTDEGQYTLRMHFRYLLAMPELDENVDLGKVRLNMNVRQPYYKYKLQIGVITDMDNPETSFVPVAVVNNSGKDMTNFECSFASVSELTGAGRHIAFKNIGGSANDLYCTNYLDDITLTYVDVDELECKISPDYIEDFEDYQVGTEPDCWEVITEDAALESTTRPQVYAGYNTTPSGSKSLRLKNRCVYAMPEFSDDYPINNFTMTFNLRQPKSIYRLQVGLVDEQGNFTALKTFKCNGTSLQEMELNFAGYDCSVGSRIAFRNTLVPGTGMSTEYLDYSINYIDDINLTYEARGRNEFNANAFDAEGSLEDIAVYPNPTTGNLYIDAMGIQKVECYNQMGQLVRVYDNVRNSIDLNNLSEGVYTLRITVPQGVTVRKVVKR